MKRSVKRLRALWRRSQLDHDLDDELSFHLAMKAEETGDAWNARRSLGNPTALKETVRELWTLTFFETCWQDVRYALRTLAKSPGFTIVAVAALALGIGVNTTVYTVVSSALRFSMGVDHIERLVLVGMTDASRRSPGGFQSALDFRELRAQVRSIPSLAAYRLVPANVSDGSALPERYSRVQISVNGLTITGSKPLLGRGFTGADELPDATPVVLLTYHVWQDRYGKDPSILGRKLRIDEVPRTVIGVMPPNIRFPEDTDLWTPLTLADLAAPGEGRYLAIFGRLAYGVRLSEARAEMDTIAHRLAEKDPENFKGLVADVHPFLDAIGIYSARRLLIATVVAVGFVLLIACADVANLLLARAAARAREVSIRIAIGAGRVRIVRQLLIESLLLASVAGLFGWLVAITGLRWFDASTSQSTRPSWIDFSLNTRGFLYLAAISLGAGILFGLAPALQLSRVDINSAVKDGGHGAAGGTRGRRLSSLIVVIAMALCIVLLTGAGLMIRSAINTYNAPIGVNASNVLTMHINLPEVRYARPEDEVSFHDRLKTKLDSLPGVEAESIASDLPTRAMLAFRFEIEGAEAAEASHLPDSGGLVVGADYFRVMQVHPRRGRVFTAADASRGSAVVVVNQAFAAKFWPGEDPLGKRLRLARGRDAQPWLSVIGIVPNIQQNFQRPLQSYPLIYLPYAADPQRVMFIVARTAVPPGSLGEAFRREVQSLDENLPVYEVRTLDDRIAQSRLNVTAFGVLFTIFAAVALVLASVGLYAVIANAVSQRTREIGVRMAVGGTTGDIVRIVFAQGMRQVAIGLAVGLPLAFGVTRVLRAALVGVSPTDPLTFIGVVLVLISAGALGCAIPARRAVRVDPVVALRCD
ncbi:MAG TPA: ABC transporter permease [Bryobacteraceae bacterium]|nr:ABC transporter permease [Bryobacteraceae bacterium]